VNFWVNISSKTLLSKIKDDTVDLILSVLWKPIFNIDWMDNITRARALNKSKSVTYLIGGPTFPRNYSDVTLSPTQFFENVLNATFVAVKRNLDTIGHPTDRTQWEMTAPTDNAYYSPTKNMMVFPAGILQAPFFDEMFPREMNAGGIGMIMGHELTHGFDNEGRLYTATGKLENWWENATNAQFNEKALCVIDQYSQFNISGVSVNGKLTQGENIADMGGVKLAYNALKAFVGENDLQKYSIVPGLTQAQLFFVAFSQTWCTKTTDEYLRLLVERDPHSPAKFRVLGPLMNLEEFSKVFQCSQNSTMYPQNRCVIW